MKRRLSVMLCLVMVLTLMVGMPVQAATKKKTTTKTTTTAVAAPTYPITINHCLIQGTDVLVIASGAQQASDDGNYYLFSLEPYEAGIGARVDYCAAVPKADIATFTTPLNLNKANSKLYSRFQVAVLKGGQFVNVSNDFYITNPEAVANHTTAIPLGSKKGFTMDWRYASDLKDTAAGYASYELDISRFCQAGGTKYTYNGVNYSFSSAAVAEYDAVCKMVQNNGAHLIMVIKNSFHPATADLIYPFGRVPGYNSYAMNVGEAAGTQKIEALMHFLAERYSNTGHGTIHSWIIGNEVNNNAPWHFAGNYDVNGFTEIYAKEVRLCYTAIKSVNANARVYINLDQRWNFADGTPNQYGGKSVLDALNAKIKSTGDIDWGVSFHPHPLPLMNAQFWNIPANYAGMKLVDHTENTKFIIPTNIAVLNNYMCKPEMLKADGTPRHTIVSEMSFTSGSALYPTNEQIQAAAMVYAYKLCSQQPVIEAVVIHRQLDNAQEIAGDGMAVGLRHVNGQKKYAYDVFKFMDQGTNAYTEFALPIIGAANWAQLGLQ